MTVLSQSQGDGGKSGVSKGNGWGREEGKVGLLLVLVLVVKVGKVGEVDGKGSGKRLNLDVLKVR